MHWAICLYENVNELQRKKELRANIVETNVQGEKRFRDV